MRAWVLGSAFRVYRVFRAPWVKTSYGYLGVQQGRFKVELGDSLEDPVPAWSSQISSMYYWRRCIKLNLELKGRCSEGPPN